MPHAEQTTEDVTPGRDGPAGMAVPHRAAVPAPGEDDAPDALAGDGDAPERGLPCVSAKQREANRRNARKSTGPRTAAGKRRARRNALRHGLCAEQVLLPDESPKEFRRFRRALFEALLYRNDGGFWTAPAPAPALGSAQPPFPTAQPPGPAPGSAQPPFPTAQPPGPALGSAQPPFPTAQPPAPAPGSAQPPFPTAPAPALGSAQPPFPTARTPDPALGSAQPPLPTAPAPGPAPGSAQPPFPTAPAPGPALGSAQPLSRSEPDALECLLAERVVAAAWRLRRALRIEAGVLAVELAELREDFADAGLGRMAWESVPDDPRSAAGSTGEPAEEPAPVPDAFDDAAQSGPEQAVACGVGAAWARQAKGGDALGRLVRYEAGLERALYRALHELERAQAARLGEPLEPVRLLETLIHY